MYQCVPTVYYNALDGIPNQLPFYINKYQQNILHIYFIQSFIL